MAEKTCSEELLAYKRRMYGEGKLHGTAEILARHVDLLAARVDALEGKKPPRRSAYVLRWRRKP